ncbi:MAG: DUF7689 domain-containing protein [Egibacteraceae bacterium]
MTSPSSRAYNCVAWSLDDSTRWWSPGSNWRIFNGHCICRRSRG